MLNAGLQLVLHLRHRYDLLRSFLHLYERAGVSTKVLAGLIRYMPQICLAAM